MLSIGLIVAGFSPSLFSIKESDGELMNEYVFKKATSNISKLRALIQECKTNQTEIYEGREINSPDLPEERKMLIELEIILAYQHEKLAQINYINIREKSFRREATPIDVQHAYREYESATLYLSRLLEKYPQGEYLLKQHL